MGTFQAGILFMVAFAFSLLISCMQPHRVPALDVGRGLAAVVNALVFAVVFIGHLGLISWDWAGPFAMVANLVVVACMVTAQLGVVLLGAGAKLFQILRKVFNRFRKWADKKLPPVLTPATLLAVEARDITAQGATALVRTMGINPDDIKNLYDASRGILHSALAVVERKTEQLGSSDPGLVAKIVEAAATIAGELPVGVLGSSVMARIEKVVGIVVGDGEHIYGFLTERLAIAIVAYQVGFREARNKIRAKMTKRTSKGDAARGQQADEACFESDEINDVAERPLMVLHLAGVESACRVLKTMDKMGVEAEYDEVNRRRALLTRIRAEKKREEELGEDSVDYDEERKNKF